MSADQTLRWRRRKDARPSEIIDAALDCFAERGFAATRLDDVAARAGVTKGTLYLYFKSKEELFKAVVIGFIVPEIEQIEAVAQIPGPVTEILGRIAAYFAEKVVKSRLSAIPKLVIAESSNFPDLARFYLNTVIDRARRLLISLFRRGIDSGEFREFDVEHTVYCVIAPILFSALWKHSLEPFDAKPLDTEALIRCHVGLLQRGLAADGSRPRSAKAATQGEARRGSRR